MVMMHLGCSFTYAQHNADNKADGESQSLRRGVVVDEYGNPVKNVHIAVKGQSFAVETNEAGYFEIDTPETGTLVFSHPDFDTYQLKVAGSRHWLVGKADDDTADSDVDADDMETIDEYLSSSIPDDYLPVRLTNSYLKDPDKINAVYGTANPKTAVGAVSSIYTEQLSTTPAPSYAYALPGRLAGLYTEQIRGFSTQNISASSVNEGFGDQPTLGIGEPTDNSVMQLSLRNQNPVVLIDGIQRNIFSVDPANIESISVQKDALSAIALGQRSSRGVLVVTTKEPEAEKLQLSFRAQTGMQQSLKMPDPLPAYQYAYLMNEALQNDGQRRAYSAEDFEALRNGTDPYGHPTVNWYDRLLRDHSYMSNYSLNVSDGSDLIRYFVSMNYLNQQGFFKTSDVNSYDTNIGLDRYVINSKVDVDVIEDLNVGLQLFGRVEDGNQPGAAANSILTALYTTPNNAYPVQNTDGSYGGKALPFSNNLLSQVVNSGYIQNNSRDVMINLDFDYNMDDLLEGLSVTAASNFVAQTARATFRDKRSPVYDMSVEEGDTTYTLYGQSNPQSNNYAGTGNSRFWYMRSALKYDNHFGKNGIGINLMADRRSVILDYDLPDVTSNFVAEGNYNYGNKYFAEAAVNYSGYNGYEPGHQYGLFYAFGLGWDIAGENFIKDNLSWLNQLKIRGVYGETGNGVDNAGYYIWRPETYSGQHFAYPIGTNRNLGFNDGWLSNGLSNPNITWEKGQKISAGVDISLFNNRLQLTGDYYHDEYYDLLQQRGSTIDLMGLGYPAENIGRNRYRGVELSLIYQNHIGNLNYFVGGNWSVTDSEVLYMDEQERRYEWNRRTGKPVGTTFGFIADGFFDSAAEIEQSATVQGLEAQPGDIKYRDLNEDGTIDRFDVAPIANDKPLSFFGLTTGFSFKGFDFSMLVQGVYNRDRYVPLPSFELHQELNEDGDPVTAIGQGYEYMLNRWTPETVETATYPRLTTTGTAFGTTYNQSPNGNPTSFWVESGNYIRLKNVSLKYSLPYRWTHGINISEMKIFINALNVFTVAAYDRIDPEVTSFTNYPLQQVISTGINIKL